MSRLCPECRHLTERHGADGCLAYYSTGPSGTFRCACKRPGPPRPAARREAGWAHPPGSHKVHFFGGVKAPRSLCGRHEWDGGCDRDYAGDDKCAICARMLQDITRRL